MVGTWKPLKNQPGFSADTMLLLTEGTVLCHEGSNRGGTSNWHKLTPDQYGCYINGTWSNVASMPDYPNIGSYAPTDFASAVLKDGRVFVAGGEYNGGAEVNTPIVEIYDPTDDTWVIVAPPDKWDTIRDAPCCVLPDGSVLIGYVFGTKTAIYDPVTKRWRKGDKTNTKRDADWSAEESWALLPDNTVLTIECNNHPATEKYVIDQDKWVTAGNVQNDLCQPMPGFVPEVGPLILLPDGRVFGVGASGHTALYTPPAPPNADQPGTWTASQDIPQKHNQIVGAMDAPACLLPNGKVLCAVSPVSAGTKVAGFYTPTYFYEFDPSNDANHFAAVPDSSNSGWECYTGRMLLLPTGQVLFSNGSGDIEVYTPDGKPDPSWKPTITNGQALVVLQIGMEYTLNGTQLNGLSQAVAYGDDASMATNYPLVQFTNRDNGKVFYGRTFNHSSMGVATGNTPVTTQFMLYPQTDGGNYDLRVIANGISSDPVQVQVIGFGNLIKENCLFWKGNFTNTEKEDILFYHPTSKNWWIGILQNGTINWNLARNTAGFGQVADGRPFWKPPYPSINKTSMPIQSDFNGDGRDDILFYSPSDDNWWLGTFDVNGNLSWYNSGNTLGFGHGLNNANHTFWIGDFKGIGRTQIIFYFSGDDSWHLGTFDDKGNLTWITAGNTIGFGHGLVNANHTFWIGEFQGLDKDQVLFYFSGDDSWHLGTFDDKCNLTWITAGNTIGFGHGLVNANHTFWIGDFQGVDSRQVLFYFSSDDSWHLGTFDDKGKLSWNKGVHTTLSPYGEKLDLGKVNAVPSWVGNFSNSYKDDLLVYDAYGRFFLGVFDEKTGAVVFHASGNTVGWGNNPDFGNLVTEGAVFLVADFAGANNDQILFYYHDGSWWLGTMANKKLNWGLVGNTGS